MPPETDPNDDKNKPAPTPGMSEEEVGRIVNAAVVHQLKRLLPTAVTEALGGLKLDEQIAAAIAKNNEQPPDDAGGKKPGTKSDLEKTVQDLAAKLEAAEKATKEAERLRIETEQARRLDAGTTAFRSALQTKLRPELLDVAVSHWGQTQGRLKLGEDGSPLLRVKRSPYKGAPEQDEDLPLSEALPILLASEEAKPFLPAPSAPAGHGGGAPRTIARGADGMPHYDKPATSDEEKARRSVERETALRQRLQSQGYDPNG